MMLEIVLFGMDAPPLVWWRAIPAPILMLPRGWFEHHERGRNRTMKFNASPAMDY